MSLAHNICEPCQVGSPQLSAEDLKQALIELPLWHITEEDNIKHFERAFVFTNFVTALAFTNRVGALAEEQGHHPAILTEWGKVTISWWTHKIGGLHKNDIIMAAKTDTVYAG